VSTESIASSSPAQAPAAAPCPGCGAPLVEDQRYCLECGERRVPMSSFLFGGATQGPDGPSAPTPATPPPSALPASGAPQRSQTLTVIAGVGVLLLAMGVGVLIGRAGNSKQASTPAPVITVAQPTGTAGTGSASSEATFTSDWPSGTSGYTVQLQTLPQAGTSVASVESAKSAASAKGAKSVGALKSEEFSSLTSGNYVIYSGVYHANGEAAKALASLRKSFPGAKVIKVSNSGGAGSSNSTGAGSSSGGLGGNESHPAPLSKVAPLKGAKGKSYEEKSKNLPNVVETG
jgi:hypothetical protein